MHVSSNILQNAITGEFASHTDFIGQMAAYNMDQLEKLLSCGGDPFPKVVLDEMAADVERSKHPSNIACLSRIGNTRWGG